MHSTACAPLHCPRRGARCSAGRGAQHSGPSCSVQGALSPGIHLHPELQPGSPLSCEAV